MVKGEATIFDKLATAFADQECLQLCKSLDVGTA